MAKCNIIRIDNEVVYTEAPNGKRSILFDALVENLGDKSEALKAWLSSKTAKFQSNISNPKLTKHRIDLLHRLKATNFKDNEITLNINGNKVAVNLNDITFTNVKRVGFSSVSAYVTPKGAKQTEVPEEGLEVVISPKNEADLLKINKYLFELNEEQALAAATTMDLMVDTMAKRANISKSEMYDKIGFGKSTAEQLKDTAALFQGSEIFKSTAQEGILKLNQKSANAQQWVKMISDKGGKGTSQELEWIGLEDFLVSYQAENKVKSVPVEVVKQYIKDNQIEIREVVKEAPTEEDIDTFLEDEAGEGYSREEAFSILNQGREGEITAYSSYTLPKGENYKEVLLMLPPSKSLEIKRLNTELNKLEKEYGRIHTVEIRAIEAEAIPLHKATDEASKEAFKALHSKKLKLQEEADLILKEQIDLQDEIKRLKADGFKSVHWTEKNILAHIRMNSRTLDNGERVLFLEEVQSDWAQEGKKEGFYTREVQAKLNKAKAAVEKINSLEFELTTLKLETSVDLKAASKTLRDGGYTLTINAKGNGDVRLDHLVNELGLPAGEAGEFKVRELEDGKFYISDKEEANPNMLFISKELATKNLTSKSENLNSFRDRPIADEANLTPEEAAALAVERDFYKKVHNIEEEQLVLSEIEGVNLNRDFRRGTKNASLNYTFEGGGNITDMPYKKTTQWAGMAMRRVMLMATEEGFDRIAWTTGAQQTSRYDLSNQVDSIEVTKRPNVDSYRIKVNHKYGDSTDTDYIAEADLEGMLGKDLAEKIIAENTHPETPLKEVLAKDEKYLKLAAKRDSLDDRKGGTPTGDTSWFQASQAAQEYVDANYSEYQSTTRTYEGLDLEVGGEGMRAFYDRMLPNIAKTEARRFDKKSRIENIDILVAAKNEPIPYNSIDSTSKALVAKYEDGDMSDQELIDKLKERGLDVKFDMPLIPTFYDSNVKSSYSTQQSIAITSKARMNLNSSIPLFQGEKGAMLAADSKFIIYALTNPNVSTPLHELAHVYEKYLTKDEVAKVLNWTKQDSWNTETSENFARGFEKYLSEGKAPIPELQALFDNFKQWLLDIYNGIIGSEIDVELNSDMKAIYAKMFGVTLDTTIVEGVSVLKSESTNPSFEDMLDFKIEGGVLEIGKIKGKDSYSILHLKVEENQRRKGLATKLLQRALAETKGLLTGMASNDGAIELNYKLGMRATQEGKELSLEETKAYRASVSWESVMMKLPESEIKKLKQNDTKGKARLFSKSGAKNANKTNFIGKGAASSQGTRLVEADQLVKGQEVFYKGSSYEVLNTAGVNSTIRRGDSIEEVENSKLLVEVGEVKDSRSLDLTSKDPNTLNQDALNNEVFNRFRINNLEPSDNEVLGTSAYVKYIMDGKITAKQAIAKAVSKFKKLGNSPIHSTVNKKAAGSNTTTPNTSYNDAVRNNDADTGDNLWVRNESSEANEDRVLMVQFASSLLYGKEDFKRSLNSKYFDSLYRLIPGYNRTSDFWEVPLWMASMAGMESKSDVYVIRDLAEAQKFLGEAKYKRVLFSALDVNEKSIESLATNLPNQEFAIGGYTAFENLSKLPNANIFKSTEEYSKSYGVKDTGVYSYRHFKGTETIPRLKMSEGCTYKCAFCSIPKKVIAVPQKEIDKMVDSLQDLDATLVYLDDKTFGQAKNFRALPEIYKKLKSYNPGFEGFIIQTTSVDFADKKKFGAEYLKASGIKYVELGIETYNDDVLTKLNKKHSHKKFTDAAMQNIRENGLKAIPNIVVGLSWNEGGAVKTETAETYKNTLNFLTANRDIISHLNVYSLAIYEGTPLGDSIEVKEEADKNENVTTKSWQTNKDEHVKAMDMFSQFAITQVESTTYKTEDEVETEVEPIKLGRLRYKENATTIEVDSSLLTPLVRQEEGKPATDIKGLGIGSQMYSQLFKLAIQKGKQLISSDNLSPNSKKLWDTLVSKGVAVKSGDRYEMKMYPNDFDSNGEPSVNNVLNFVDRESSQGTLSEEELVELKEVMIGLPVSNSSELYTKLRKGFFTEGKFRPTRASLKASGLYMEDDVVDILSDADLQESIKSYIYRLEKTEVEVSNDIYTDENFLVVKDGSKNAIGKLKLANPYEFEKIVIAKLGNSTTRQEFEEALMEDEDLEVLTVNYEANKYSVEDLYYKITDFKPAAIANLKGGSLVAQQSPTEMILENALQIPTNDILSDSINFLLQITPTVWRQTQGEVNLVLDAIAKEMAEIGIDATELTKTALSKKVSEVKTFLAAVNSVVTNDSRDEFDNLVSVYNEFFNISSDYQFKHVKLKENITPQNVFYVDSELSNIELFDKLGLVAVGPNVYKRVSTTKGVEDLYEFIYSKIQADGYSTIIPNDAVYPAAYGEDNMLDISKLTDLNNRDSIIDSIRNYVENKATEIFVGDSKINKEALEKFVIMTNFYNRSANVSKFEPTSSMQAEYAIFKGVVDNELYLKTDFASDFYATILRNKLSNTKAYQDFYSNFSINNTGIQLDNTDPITLNRMKPYLAKNADLKNYFNLRKEGFNIGVIEEIEPATNELFLRNFYSNFPTKLKVFTGDYQRLSKDVITAISKEAFLRLNNGVYEFIEGVGKTGVYARLTNNQGIFKEYNKEMALPELDIDLNRIKPTVENLNSKTVINNKYSEAEASRINDKFDNCK